MQKRHQQLYRWGVDSKQGYPKQSVTDKMFSRCGVAASSLVLLPVASEMKSIGPQLMNSHKEYDS